nr:reverse transcriptase domain-containing protein [Tanacetum cinerariifolium]
MSSSALEALWKTLFNIDVIDEILEVYFDAFLEECSEILHSIEGTILKEKLFAEFDEFMATTADENSEYESDIEEPPFEKITFNTDYKIKTSLEEPPTDLELKPLPNNLEYAFLKEPSFLSVIISSQLSEKNKKKVYVLRRRKQAFAWKTTDILRIYPFFSKHKIQLMEDKKLVDQKQRRLNPNMQEVLKKKLLNSSIQVSEAGLEVDKAKIDVISKLLPYTNIEDIKGTENVTANYLSQIENDETSDDSEVFLEKLS